MSIDAGKETGYPPEDTEDNSHDSSFSEIEELARIRLIRVTGRGKVFIACYMRSRHPVPPF